MVTGAMVLGLAVYGTADSSAPAAPAAARGRTRSPSRPAPRNAMQIQVIGQQWLWTFRYPGYGGVETTALELPVSRLVEFHVTSLDVMHSFWAIELGIKADAVQGADNVATASR